MSMDSPARAHPSIVLSVHIEPLVRGRRVAVLGDATSGLAERLGKQGARLLHAYDPDAGRAAEALARSAGHKGSDARLGGPPAPHITFAALGAELGVRDGAFDVVVIPDLALFADAADILRRARRLVSPSGVAVVVSPNPEAETRLLSTERPPRVGELPSYYELYDLVSLQWSVVRMLGQAPFVGYTVADFAPEGEPSVAVDTSLLEATEHPEWFIAVGSERPIELEAYALVQVPLEMAGIGVDGAKAAEAADDRLALTEARARLSLLTAELEGFRERQRTDLREVEARAQAAATMAARIAELEAELGARDARFKEVQGRAGDAHVRAERLSHQITDLEEELARQRDRATKLAKQLDDEKKARTKAEMELGMIRNRPEIAGAKDRLQELSTELESARARVAELESERAPSVIPAPPPPVAIRAAPQEQFAHTVEITRHVDELETAVTDARRALAEVAMQRDQARRRAEELERSLEAAARERTSHAMERTTLEKKCAALEAKAAGLEARATELEARCKALEARVADLQAKATDLEKSEAELKKRAADLEKRSEEPDAAVVGDLAAAEALLRERGRLIASLRRDLQESERIGRELVEEVEALRALATSSGGSSGPSGGGGGGGVTALTARLDTLAERSARCEADYQAATWRIAQLERELTEARAGSPGASGTHRDLEKALSAARAEVDALRRALEASEHQAFGLARAATEGSVLLHQVSGQASGSVERRTT
jgi:predicted  nucleic acid-binding Zn-ribbon protein